MTLATFATTADPITLDALVDQAGMMTRVDRKYLLDTAALDALTEEITGPVTVLDIAGRRTFAYRSTYFDTPQLDAYTTAGRGRRRRFKVRTREYLDTGTTWLEVKTRGPRGTTVKRRVPHTGDPAHLGGAGRDAVALLLAEADVLGVDVGTIAATLQTSYRRTTLHLAGSPSPDPRPATRATIDTDLSWVDLRDGAGVERPDLAIVETKGVRAPSPVDRLLWRQGLRPRSVSKYGAGLARLRPDVPALKWHRVATGCLAGGGLRPEA